MTAAKSASQPPNYFPAWYNHRWIDAGQFRHGAFDFVVPFGYRIGARAREGLEFYPGWDPELGRNRDGNYVAAPAD